MAKHTPQVHACTSRHCTHTSNHAQTKDKRHSHSHSHMESVCMHTHRCQLSQSASSSHSWMPTRFSARLVGSGAEMAVLMASMLSGSGGAWTTISFSFSRARFRFSISSFELRSTEGDVFEAFEASAGRAFAARCRASLADCHWYLASSSSARRLTATRCSGRSNRPTSFRFNVNLRP